MRVHRTAIVVVLLAAGLSAQSGKQFVRPPAGQTPPYSLGIKAGGAIYVAGQLPTDDKGALVSPYTYAIKSGDTLYLSGLVSRSGRDNAQVQGDIATQTKTIMDNAGEILKAAMRNS